MDYEVELGGQVRNVRVVNQGSGEWTVQIDDGPVRAVTGGPLGDGEWALRLGDERRVAGVAAHRDRVDVQLRGRAFPCKAVDARKAALQLGSSVAKGLVCTAMPGVVVRILVGEGDTVVQGQPVIVVEAMKMENELKAPTDGTVTAVHVKPGQTLESDAPLLLIE